MRKEYKRRALTALFAAAMSLSAFAAPRMAFQTYAVRDLCEKDFAGTLKAAAETAWIDESISTAGAALVEEYKSAASQFKGKKKEEPAPEPTPETGVPVS